VADAAPGDPGRHRGDGRNRGGDEPGGLKEATGPFKATA